MKEAIISLVFLHALMYIWGLFESNVKAFKEYSNQKRILILSFIVLFFSIWQIKDYVKSKLNIKFL